MQLGLLFVPTIALLLVAPPHAPTLAPVLCVLLLMTMLVCLLDCLYSACALLLLLFTPRTPIYLYVP